MKQQIRVSVRNLVEFILRSGDIDNRFGKVSDQAMAEGSKMHRKIQKSQGEEYQAEVALSYVFETPDYEIVIEGRADGVIYNITGVTIDEIKCTYRDVNKLKHEDPIHLAQAKCYAFMICQSQGYSQCGVRMTYCNLDTEEIKYFDYFYTGEELEKWFFSILAQYQKWTDYEYQWKKIRQESITNVIFPYEYREGQKELITNVYHTIYHEKKLFVEAPTGVGKTLSTVFPAIKAMGNGMAEKIFYFTAKTITRTVAEQSIELLREKGLQFKNVTLTAKEKICCMPECNCNPEYCERAKGHFDRVNDAIFDMLTNENTFPRACIEEYAKKHKVCPFELCLDVSLFSDGVIGDYNYLFDPHAYLRRFFSEGKREDYIFLIDEAHNLLERGREMYSAILRKEDILAWKRKMKPYSVRLERLAERVNKIMLVMKRECEDYLILESVSSLVSSLTRLSGGIEQYLEDHPDSPVRQDVLEFYFVISHFLLVSDMSDDNYVMYSYMEDKGGFAVRLFCVNPSKNLRECMDKGRSSILFSATLLPIQYYKGLLGGEASDYEVYAKSIFDSERKGLFIGTDVTSRYTRRGPELYENIAEYISSVIKCKRGNYMVFFPSYQFMENVYECFEKYSITYDIDAIKQENSMNEQEKEEFLNRFMDHTGGEGYGVHGLVDSTSHILKACRSLVGFCVLGGIFSEGIDLKSDQLIGAIIVGTGLPQVCLEREILKSYFDEKNQNGFEYAYKFPGMNKVLQAAGRVIRTASDIGIVVLLDNRFCQNEYKKMFPREWEHYEIVSKESVSSAINNFWEHWHVT